MISLRKFTTLAAAFTVVALLTPTTHAQTTLKENSYDNPLAIPGVTGTGYTCPPGYIGSYPACYPLKSGTVDSTGTTTPTVPTSPTPTDPTGCANVQALDPTMAETAIRTALDTLWKSSTPTARWGDRNERGGWLVRTADGGTRIHLWAEHPNADARGIAGCGDIEMWWLLQQLPPEGLSAIVGMVHTHPYNVGEAIQGCGYLQFETYQGRPSDDDYQAAATIASQMLGRTSLPSYVIDGGGMRKYNTTLNAYVSMGRCGY